MEFIGLIILFINTLILFIVIYNFFKAPILKKSSARSENQIEDLKISVLVPARNEQGNIKKCIFSILNQSYGNKEIIVLDDGSTDSTYKIIKDISQSKENDIEIKVISGKTLPNSWIGKNWACSQLAKEATGDILLFLDADVYLNKYAIAEAVRVMQQDKLSLLSIFPTQKMKSTGEYTIVPILNWILLSFLPLDLVYKSKYPSLTTANGQFMMFDKKSYDKLGGHEKIKNILVEDIHFAKSFKKAGLKVKAMLSKDLVSCRMYSNFRTAYNGLLRSLGNGISSNGLVSLLTITCLSLIFSLPFVFLLENFNFLFSAILIIVGRVLISLKSKQSVCVTTLFLPLNIIFLLFGGYTSVLVSKLRKLTWKDRVIGDVRE